MGRTAKTKSELRSIVQTEILTASQDLANRIYSGQSPDLPVHERVERIVNALKARGFELDFSLPDPNAERFINAAKAKQ